MPGADFKRQAARWRKHAIAMLQRPFATVDEALVCVTGLLFTKHPVYRFQTRGSVTPCIATSMLSRLDGDENKMYMKDVYRNAAASAYIGESYECASSE